MTEPIEMNVVEYSPAAMYNKAVDTGQDLAQVEKAMELQERWEANEARKAYHVAMAAFKANPPEIEKNKTVGYEAKGKLVGYKHASLDNVSRKINDALSPHGLHATWKTTQANGDITVTCTIAHALGHSESTSLTAGPDTTGSKNAIQALGSTIAYLERYTVLAITGLATSDMDDDAAGAGSQKFITPEQVAKLTPDIKKYYGDGVLFLQYLQAETVETITVAQYATAVQWIKDIKAGKVKPKKQDRTPGEEG